MKGSTEMTYEDNETITITRERLRTVFELLDVVAPCPGSRSGVRLCGGALADEVMDRLHRLAKTRLPDEPGLWMDDGGDLWACNGHVAVLLGSDASGWNVTLRPHPVTPDGLVGECAPFT